MVTDIPPAMKGARPCSVQWLMEITFKLLLEYIGWHFAGPLHSEVTADCSLPVSGLKLDIGSAWPKRGVSTDAVWSLAESHIEVAYQND